MPVDGTTQPVQVAGMPDLPNQTAFAAADADIAGPLPAVELEVRHGGRTTTYNVSHVDFLIGTVPGCDLRVAGADLPAVLCLLARKPGGFSLRKLAATQLILVNGQTTTRADLRDGDRITLGAMDLFVRLKNVEVMKPEVVKTAPAPAEAALPVRELRERPSIETSPRQPVAPADLEKQRQELATMRQELADIRGQLYERYQERRDRLAGLQEAVDRAAQKVQERKRQLDLDEEQSRQRRHEDAARRATLEKDAAVLDEGRQRLANERRLFEESNASVRADVAAKLADLESREETLAEARRELDARQRQHQADLIRLDRLQGALEEREQAFQEQKQDADARLAQLQSDSADLESQVVELDALRAQVARENEQLTGAKEAHDKLAADLAQRLRRRGRSTSDPGGVTHAARTAAGRDQGPGATTGCRPRTARGRAGGARRA